MTNLEAEKYVFSGHESFPCKSLWLKKGYDFVVHDLDFYAPDAVSYLGVGKNMVAAIRYWLKAFQLLDDNHVTDMAKYLLDDESGKDPYMEDSGTLWLLHLQLVLGKKATLYNMFFRDFQKERKEFDREQVLNFVKRKMVEAGKDKLFNPNTVKKDISVLLQNYALPQNAHSHEEFSNLLIDLDLLRQNKESKSYYFNLEGKRPIPPEIFLFALLKIKSDEDKSVSYDILQELGFVFCMTDLEIIQMAKRLSDLYPDKIAYNDVAGIRQLQFTSYFDIKIVLDHYYDSII